MSELKKLEPNLTEALLTVEIPVRTEMMIFAGRTLQQWVELFTQKSKNARTVEEKRDADMCRFVTEWAGNCEGNLSRIFNDKDKNGNLLVMELKFTDINQAAIFGKELKQRVSEGLGE